MGFKKFGVLLLLLLISVQLHLPLAHTTSDLNQEQNVTTNEKRLSMSMSMSVSVKLGGKQNMRVINKHGGAGHGGGGGHAGGGHVIGGGGRGGAGGRQKSPRSQGGAVIPVYGGGAMNRPRNSHGSNGGTLNYISLNYLILALFTSFSLTYF